MRLAGGFDCQSAKVTIRRTVLMIRPNIVELLEWLFVYVEADRLSP